MTLSYNSDTPDIGDMDPQAAHGAWEELTDLDADALRDLRDTPEHEAYLETASEQRQGDDDPPIPGGPLDDAIHLAETPADEWGQEEVAEADEVENWVSRHGAQFDPGEGEGLTPGDGQKITRADVAAARWGFDFREGDGWP